MFNKILIANRGEIACRVAATARRLGVKTVAVYAPSDCAARHVAMCDQAFLIGSASYLDIAAIIAVAMTAGAEAVHPGYGFLSENADFARACGNAGLVFIGPPASAMAAMASKSSAKALMAQAGVPLTPGYHGAIQTRDFLRRQAGRIGYPVLIKASSGGGGKGMRIVWSSDQFDAALASCQREAASSFGVDHVLLEKYLERARHIEIQVFADQHGQCIHLFERDCSVQRRHQKVIEEAPAPGMTPGRRQALGAAALAAAQAVGYVGAGTVEFIVDADDAFYFMEMNTRLQVEHAVTEMITGLDLVEWQLRIACGEPLPLTQAQVQIDGHALEARIYAENPEQGFLPATGTLLHLRMPPALQFECRSPAMSNLAAIASFDVNADARSVRIDSGVREGDSISPFYDPLIAKLIVRGATREQALQRMAQALSAYHIAGVANNIGFLRRLISSPAFASLDVDTGFIEHHHAQLFPPAAPASLPLLALAAAALLASEQGSDASDPWATTSGWRLNGVLVRAIAFTDDAQTYALKVEYHGPGWRIGLVSSDAMVALHIVQRSDEGSEGKLVIELDGQIIRASVVRDGDHFHVFEQDRHILLSYVDPLAHESGAEVAAGSLRAPMPGKIVALHVRQGDAVTTGMPLLVMEAMKMEHTVLAPGDGVIAALLFDVGDQVSEGAQLLRLRI